MNNQYIELTHFVGKKKFHLNVSKIVSIEYGEDEGNSRVTTCLNFSYYTVERPEQILYKINNPKKAVKLMHSIFN